MFESSVSCGRGRRCPELFQLEMVVMCTCERDYVMLRNISEQGVGNRQTVLWETRKYAARIRHCTQYNSNRTEGNISLGPTLEMILQYMK